MRFWLIVAAAVGAAAWFNPGNILNKVGLRPVHTPPETAASSTQVRKWQDANGQIVFGDARSVPRGSHAETVKLAAPNVVSMPKAPPPAANDADNAATAPGPAADGAMPAAPKPRNLALERIAASLPGKQK